MSSASLVRAWREANIWKRAYCRSLRENALLNEDIAFLRRELAAAHTRAAPLPSSKKRKHEASPAALPKKKGKKNDCSCDGYCADCGEPCKECPEKHRD